MAGFLIVGALALYFEIRDAIAAVRRWASK